MTRYQTHTLQTSPRRLWRRYIVAFTGVYLALLPPGLYANDHRRPAVPSNLEVPERHRPFQVGHATGTQQYVCIPANTVSGFSWSFFGPQATLSNDHDRQTMTHFLSPNPDEAGLARATWQHSRDTSTIWAVAIDASTDPNFVEPGAIPWLLLQVVGAEFGPTRGDNLTETTYVQRIHTSGGLAPLTGCAQATDIGKRALVPYTADYVFYQASRRE